MQEIKEEDKATYTKIQKYLKWDKLKLTETEREFANMGVRDGTRTKSILKYIMKQKNRNETYARLKDAGIITDEVAEQIKAIQTGEQK